jgi:hypothetical protein
MEQVYFVCAVAGGTIFACHLMMGLLGLGESHDSLGESLGDSHGPAGGIDDGSSWLPGILSLRGLMAGVTFFGLGGLATSGAATSGAAGAVLISVVVATGAGLAAAAFVAWVMVLLGTLRADGTIRIESAVGREATVYLPIPARKAGTGKVTLGVQNRTMEYPAVTAGDALAAGEPVVVVGVAGPDTVEVTARGGRAWQKLLRAGS